MSSLPARILDDYMVCRTRAYYTAHPELFKPRRIPDMEDSEQRGRVFVSRHLIPSMQRVSAEAFPCRILKLEDCNEESRTYYLAYKDLDKEIACRPDMVSIVLLRGNFLRALVFEVGDTDVDTVLRKRHVIPRILFYMVAAYLHYGAPPIGFYVSLSPKSPYPAIALVSKRGRVKLSRLLKEIGKLASLAEAPTPAGDPACSHCVYTPICRFAM